jgi:integrase
MRWSLFKEGQVWVIRRWEGGRYKRLPVKRYRGIRDDYEKLSEFVKRLNAPIDVKEAVDYKHAFISPKLLDDYRDFLLAQIPTRKDALCEYAYLKEYFLDFFIGKLNLKNPLDWHKTHKTKWSTFLMGHADIPAPATKRKVVMAANRFMGWLHQQRPEDTPSLHFEPISKATYKKLEAQRLLDGEAKERTFIPDAHWDKIKKGLPQAIAPFALLSYHYGLRRAESLGFKQGDVKKGYLSVERQLMSLNEHAPLKGRLARKVPHWSATAAQAYGWTVQSFALTIHPDTLSDRWAEYMKGLDFKYDFHDLRHTWITRMMRKQHHRDVQLAAGHVNIETTMGYAHDDRAQDDEEFRPAS